MAVAFKIDANKFVKTRNINSLKDVLARYTVYTCEKKSPDKIDKIYTTFDTYGNDLIVFEPLSYYGEISVDIIVDGKTLTEHFNENRVFVALPEKEALQCDYYWTLQKLPEMAGKVLEMEAENGNKL